MESESKLDQLLNRKEIYEAELNKVNEAIKKEAEFRFSTFIARIWYYGIRHENKKGKTRYMRLDNICQHLNEKHRQEIELIIGSGNYSELAAVGKVISKLNRVPFEYYDSQIVIVKSTSSDVTTVRVENFKV